MRLLVTGGAGYVGSVLVPLLLSAGHEVHVVDNLTYGQASLLACFRDPRFTFTSGDVRDRALMQEAVGDADAIIHLAAVVGMPACDKNPTAAEEINVNSTRLINDLRSPDQWLLYASTGSVYGAVDGVCTEDTPASPLSTYGATKYEGERIALSKPNAIAYRFATAFGVAPRFRLDLLLNNFVYLAIRERNIVLYEREAKRTLIHVHDIARSWVHALDHFDSMRDQAFNVGDESLNYSKREIVEAIRDEVEFYVDYADFAHDPDQRDYVVSYEKIRATGFKTEVDLKTGIRELTRAMAMVWVPNPYSNDRSPGHGS